MILEVVQDLENVLFLRKEQAAKIFSFSEPVPLVPAQNEKDDDNDDDGDDDDNNMAFTENTKITCRTGNYIFIIALAP